MRPASHSSFFPGCNQRPSKQCTMKLFKAQPGNPSKLVCSKATGIITASWKWRFVCYPRAEILHLAKRVSGYTTGTVCDYPVVSCDDLTVVMKMCWCEGQKSKHDRAMTDYGLNKKNNKIGLTNKNTHQSQIRKIRCFLSNKAIKISYLTSGHEFFNSRLTPGMRCFSN